MSGTPPRRPHPELLWRWLALWLLVALLLPSGVAAQEPPAAGTAPAPLGDAGVVVMVSQTLDATLRQDEGGNYVADVRAATKLHNTAAATAVNPLFGWPGWAGDDIFFDPARLPGFDIARGGVPIGREGAALSTTFGGESREGVGWVTTRQNLGRDERVLFTSAWTQALAPANSPLVTFRYGLLPAALWSGPVGSIRATIILPELTTSEQIVSATPISPTFGGDKVEWILVEEEPQSNLTLTLIAPHLWREIVATRTTLNANPADVGAALRLADLYGQLAGAGLQLYDNEAEAVLLAVRETVPTAPEPHQRLGDRYRTRVGEGETLNVRYLQLAADAYAAALEAGWTGPEATTARTFVSQAYRDLAARWYQSGDERAALEALNDAARWSEGSLADEINAQRRDAAAGALLTTLEREGLIAALDQARREGLPTHDEQRLPLATLDAALATSPEGRRLVLNLRQAEGVTDTFRALTDDLLARLQSVPDASLTSQTIDTSTTLTITWGADQEPGRWVETGRALAAALPDTPIFDLPRSALSPNAIRYGTGASAFSYQYAYDEGILLVTRVGDVATQLQSAANQAGNRWEQGLLMRHAEDWERFATAQTITYDVSFVRPPLLTLPGKAEPGSSATLRRVWRPAIPSDTTLSYTVETPRLDRWFAAIAGAALLLLIGITAIWRWPMR